MLFRAALIAAAAALLALPITTVLIAGGLMAQGRSKRPRTRPDPGWTEGLLPRDGWRGAAALKTWRVVIAVGCVFVAASAGWSSGLPATTTPSTPALAPVTSAVKDPLIPGIGATRADWDAAHTPNAAFNNEKVYGDDPKPALVSGG
jgi:hypothetical protein